MDGYTMDALKRFKKRRRNKAKLAGRAPRKASKTDGQPNETLPKFPEETYGDRQPPFARR
jgi:hypothetical protein